MLQGLGLLQTLEAMPSPTAAAIPEALVLSISKEHHEKY